jgi:hypothetical protein
LKLLINLALKQFEAAQELVGSFLQYNDNTVERGLFYQALNVVLEVMLDDDLELDDYVVNFRRMFGNARMDAVIGSVDGSVRFFGLTPTSMKLEGLDRHQRLIDSYKKCTRRAPRQRLKPVRAKRHGCDFAVCLVAQTAICCRSGKVFALRVRVVHVEHVASQEASVPQCLVWFEKHDLALLGHRGGYALASSGLKKRKPICC